MIILTKSSGRGNQYGDSVVIRV